ncbi:MAG: GNAT family N-acetyltransferase [Cyanobacteria bacterium J06598_3]
MDYLVRLATPQDVPFLAEIESSAAQRFLPYLNDLGIPVTLLEGLATPDFFHRAQADDRLWVAVHSEPRHQQQPVGFIVVKFLLESCFIVELDVHADHGRKGIGSALVRACLEGTRRRGFNRTTLTTFRHIPWNIPFYRRLGFEILPPEAWPNDIRAIVQHEARYGFARDKRVVMQQVDSLQQPHPTTGQAASGQTAPTGHQHQQGWLS